MNDIVDSILISVFDKPPTSGIGGRVRRELHGMIKDGVCDPNSISFTCVKDPIFHEHLYLLKIYNLNDGRWYEFKLSAQYPFREPKLILNGKPYEEYLRPNSLAFKQALIRYTGNYCLCCKSMLCKQTWAPIMLLRDIFKEVEEFHSICRRVSNNVLVNVIKRKYLIDDINLIEWMY